MPPVRQKERERAWFTLVLAWIAGYVNAVAFIQLAHADVSHMTGDTVELGVGLVSLRLSTAALLLTPIPMFVLGMIGGVTAIRVWQRQGWRSPYAGILAVELVLLSIYVAYATAQSLRNTIQARAWWQIVLLIALPTVAMAFQTSMVHRIAGRRVRTTYITGMLSDLGEDVFALASWFRSRTTGRSWRRRYLALRVAQRQKTWVRVLLLTGLWLSFFIGALCGAYGEAHALAIALIAPLGALLVLIGVELVAPTEKLDRTPAGPS